jgi:hypothetical protein
MHAIFPKCAVNLNNLSTVSSDALGKLPALLLELNVLSVLNLNLVTLAADDRHGVFVHTPCVSVEQHLHTLLDDRNSLLTGDVGDGGLVGADTAEEGDRKVGTETRSERRAGECSSQKIRGSQETIRLCQ